MKKKASRKKYGRRADGQTQTTISLSEEVFNAAKAKAAEQGISLSKLIEIILKTGKLPLLALLGYIAAAHLTSSPTDWSAASLGASAKAGASLMIQHAAAAAEWVANKI